MTSKPKPPNGTHYYEVRTVHEGGGGWDRVYTETVITFPTADAVLKYFLRHYGLGPLVRREPKLPDPQPNFGYVYLWHFDVPTEAEERDWVTVYMVRYRPTKLTCIPKGETMTAKEIKVVEEVIKGLEIIEDNRDEHHTQQWIGSLISKLYTILPPLPEAKPAQSLEEFIQDGSNKGKFKVIDKMPDGIDWTKVKY